MTEPIAQSILTASTLPRESLFWLTVPPILFAIITIIHSIKNWNKSR